MQKTVTFSCDAGYGLSVFLNRLLAKSLGNESSLVKESQTGVSRRAAISPLIRRAEATIAYRYCFTSAITSIILKNQQVVWMISVCKESNKCYSHLFLEQI